MRENVKAQFLLTFFSPDLMLPTVKKKCAVMLFQAFFILSRSLKWQWEGSYRRGSLQTSQISLSVSVMQPSRLTVSTWKVFRGGTCYQGLAVHKNTQHTLHAFPMHCSTFLWHSQHLKMVRKINPQFLKCVALQCTNVQ